MKPDAVLERLETSDHGTFGWIWTRSLLLFTGELPWRENRFNVSRIPPEPAGAPRLYRVAWTYSPRFRRMMYLLLGTERSAECYVQGDAAATVQEIEALLAREGVRREGFRTAATRNALRGQFRDPGEFEIEPGTVDIREVLALLDEKLPSNICLLTGSAHNFSFPVWHMQKPRQHISVQAFTGVGQVLGNAIGAAVASTDPVVAVDGDGSALQNIQELDTAARLGVKLLYFIVNDEAYGAEFHKLRAKGLDGNLSAVRTPDLAAVGRTDIGPEIEVCRLAARSHLRGPAGGSAVVAVGVECIGKIVAGLSFACVGGFHVGAGAVDDGLRRIAE